MAGTTKATMASALAVALLLAMAAASVSGAVCGVDLGRMKDACESYCAAGSREARPSGRCCGALKGADFACLCKLKRQFGSFGTIDAGRAMQIPGKCGIRGVPTRC